MIYSVWLIFDGLSPKSLHAWLDVHKAKECGSNVAFLEFDMPSGFMDLSTALLKSIDQAVSFDCEDADCRIYAIWQNPNGEVKGKFIRGERRRPIWYGASYPTFKNEVDDGIIPESTSLKTKGKNNEKTPLF